MLIRMAIVSWSHLFGSDASDSEVGEKDSDLGNEVRSICMTVTARLFQACRSPHPTNASFRSVICGLFGAISAFNAM